MAEPTGTPNNAQALNTFEQHDQQAAQSGENKLFAGKFKTAEDLEKSYLELQKKLGEPGATPATPPATPGTPKETPTEISTFDDQKMINEFLQTGAISPETRADLNKRGIPDSMIDRHVSSAAAAIQAKADAILTTVGGAKAYESMASWADQNLTEAEQAVYNKALDGTDAERMAAVKGLHARWTTATGGGTTLLKGDGSQLNVGGYRSLAEMQRDMRDSRYKTDEAFREDVKRKISLSPENLF